MDPVEPWIDGDAVRRLAAQLLSSPRESEVTESSDAGFGPGFEGFTSDLAEPVGRVVAPTPDTDLGERFPTQLAAPAPLPEIIREEPVARPFLATAAASDVKEPADLGQDSEAEDDHQPPFRQQPAPESKPDDDTPRGPLMERMMRFREWMRRHAGAQSVFILDREGQPVLDDPAYAKLHFLARSLSQAYRPVPGQPGNVHVKVGAEAYLVVIPVETAFGCLVLGSVLPRPLDAPSVEIVAKSLKEAARPMEG